MVGMSRHRLKCICNSVASLSPYCDFVGETLHFFCFAVEAKEQKYLHQHLIKHNEFWLIVEVVRIYPERNKIFIIHRIQNVANMHRECNENIRAPNTLPCLSFRY